VCQKFTEWWGAGVVICLERGADLHMAQLMPLPLTVSCLKETTDDGDFGMQWHQLDHMQTICISLPTDNHTNIPRIHPVHLMTSD